MKKSTFTLLLAVLFVMQGLAQQVVQEQRLLITKRTATWCPNCGTWGWTLFKNLIDDNKDKAVLIAAHYDGLLARTAAEEITDNFGGFYQPRFFVNETDQNVNSGNIATVRTSIKNLVNTAFATGPTANVGFNPVYAGGALKVNAKVKFFKQAQGEYYLGIYLIENNVVAFQASIGNNANHQRVFRESFTPSTWGLQVVNGNVSAGQEFDLNFELPIGSPQGHDYEVVGVIWKKEGTKYFPVNVWSTNEINTATATEEPLNNFSFNVYPTLTAAESIVQLHLTEHQKAVQIDLLDFKGNLVTGIFRGALQEGQHVFRIDKNMASVNGVYLVRFQTGSDVVVRKVVFQ